MPHFRIAFLSAALVVAGLAGPARSAGPQIADYTLPNGLELVVIPDHRAPVVTHMIWYKVGAADEVPGKSGLAHFLEHLMFKGTAKHPAGEFSAVVASLGGQENAFTAADFTGYFQRVPSEQLKTVMSFEADRMNGLQLTDDKVLPERDVILEEENQRVGNNARARFGIQLDAALYLNSPYGKPTIGWRQEMEQLTRDDAIGFYRRFYGPNGAVVVIAGDVEPEQVLALAKETYGKIERNNNIMPRLRALEPPPVAARRLTMADARTEQPVVQRDYLVPSFATAERGESADAGTAGAYRGRRHQQPAVPRFGGGQANSGRSRRLVRQLLPRHEQIRRLRLAAAGRHAARSREGDRRGAGRSDRQGRHRRGARAQQDQADRRRSLHP